jgi:hypothetical protein
MKGKTARKLLPEKYRTMFENKMIVCIEYEGLNDDQEREMFQVFFSPRYPYLDFLTYLSQRVQMGMALTPAGIFISISPRVAVTFVFRTPSSYQWPLPRYNPRGS